MIGLKVRVPLGVAGIVAWFGLLTVGEFPWWFTLVASLVVGRVLTLFSLKPLLLDATPDDYLPAGLQVKTRRDRGLWPTNVRWCVLPDPYTRPTWCSDEWSILDELAHGWSLTRHLARWRGNRAVRRLQKERHGEHRQAEANPRDPNPSGATATAGAAGTTGAGADQGTREDGLEVVQGDMPILAHRAATLRFHGDGRPWGPVTQNGTPFGVDAEAVCVRFGLHGLGIALSYERQPHGPTPSVGCSCGFYALPPDLDATYGENSRVTLLVELSGRVIEHEKGYRAEHQRVVECRLPACRYCGRAAAKVDVLDGEMVQAVCVKHVPNQHTPEDPAGLGRVWLTVEDVARTLPVPFTLNGDRDGDGQ